MDWTREGHAGHEGFIIGLVEYEPGYFRELVTGPARIKELARTLGIRPEAVDVASMLNASAPTHLHAACECGWRSPRTTSRS